MQRETESWPFCEINGLKHTSEILAQQWERAEYEAAVYKRRHAQLSNALMLAMLVIVSLIIRIGELTGIVPTPGVWMVPLIVAAVWAPFLKLRKAQQRHDGY